MTAFANDCGEGIPEERRKLLEVGFVKHLGNLLDAVGPCERCRAAYLHTVMRAAGLLLERQPEAVRGAVEQQLRRDVRRVDAIEAEAHRIARELLGSAR